MLSYDYNLFSLYVFLMFWCTGYAISKLDVQHLVTTLVSPPLPYGLFTVYIDDLLKGHRLPYPF